MSEMLQEELRTRLYFIRAALQTGQDDNDFLEIQNTFTNRSFKAFFNIVDLVSTISDQKQLEEILMERLKAGKSPELVAVVNKYAAFFIEELKHFLRIHGFVKSELPRLVPVSAAKQPMLPSPAT